MHANVVYLLISASNKTLSKDSQGLDATNLANFCRFVFPQCSLYHPGIISTRLCSRLATRLDTVISASAWRFFVCNVHQTVSEQTVSGLTCMFSSFLMGLGQETLSQLWANDLSHKCHVTNTGKLVTGKWHHDKADWLMAPQT